MPYFLPKVNCNRRFPGGAPDSETLGSLLESGNNTLGELNSPFTAANEQVVDLILSFQSNGDCF